MWVPDSSKRHYVRSDPPYRKASSVCGCGAPEGNRKASGNRTSGVEWGQTKARSRAAHASSQTPSKSRGSSPHIESIPRIHTSSNLFPLLPLVRLRRLRKLDTQSLADLPVPGRGVARRSGRRRQVENGPHLYSYLHNLRCDSLRAHGRTVVR